MSQLISELRLGSRNLARRPAFTAVAVAALALGIGANTTIFTLVNALVLRPPMRRGVAFAGGFGGVPRRGVGFPAATSANLRVPASQGTLAGSAGILPAPRPKGTRSFPRPVS